MNTKQIINEAVSLPVEERARVVETLLESFNPPDSQIDKLWAKEANRRLADLQSGRVKPIPAEEVFSNIRKKLGK